MKIFLKSKKIPVPNFNKLSIITIFNVGASFNSVPKQIAKLFFQ